MLQERKNILKVLLNENRSAIGLWCSLAEALTTEVIAGSGVDWLLIDAEHSPNDLRSVVLQLQVAAAFPCEPVVRLPSDDPHQMKQFMDGGARSLMIPNVRSADQARAVVSAMRYAPFGGIRGFSVGHRANQFGRIKDYHRDARGAQFLAAQIECEKGVANAAEIAATDGVDSLFVGPGDLSTNLGAMGNPNAEHVQEAIASVLEAARTAGKPAGILAPQKADADRYLADGFTMVAVGSDLGLLARGADNLVASFRSEVA
ncbi:4-hydroxy-2-oxoheptanedioate aldolase [Paracoccus isoporae]|uniref:4-hydroxy-2-oxoheptanedioate aldolase n=1 Tax=Paracoccus isoporae TaxID=591205 RepID=A0A1G7H0N7_9RHOB|nr:HpcH/HpaI aldolase/citrate lyase family protein [Paracoccus isoporae]SDE94002.1 4-hydroxy-2-oxoheptanedioate aldolase [Paracoccus isoporae]